MNKAMLMELIQMALNSDASETVAVGNGVMAGNYVIVRCRDAGVHAGELISHHGREAHLRNGRRLWYWKPAKGAFLSGVAQYGLGDGKVGAPTETYLTEDCEILVCTPEAEESIRGWPNSHEDEN